LKFIRIRGRVIPIRDRKPNYGAGVVAGIAQGTTAAGAVYGAAKGAQYAAFKRGTRLGDIAKFHATWPAPTLAGTLVQRGRNFHMLPPDMFQEAKFKKSAEVAERMWAKGPKWEAAAGKLKGLASKLGKYALPAAAIIGVGVGVAAFMNRSRDSRKRK
jgi:hypothetical protein